MIKYILTVVFLVVLLIIIPSSLDKTIAAQSVIKWDFDAEVLAKKICKENNWLFQIECIRPASQKYFRHFRFFEVVKPIDNVKANLLILVVSQEQKYYILHQTLSFEEIEIKESFYPQGKEQALEMAALKEELSKDYKLWLPYYSLKSMIFEEDRDNLLWKIFFSYNRPALRAFPGPVYGENDTAPFILMPQDKLLSDTEDRNLTRTIQLRHPLRLEIEKLISLLGDDNWQVREKATKDLIAIGKPVMSLVKKALDNTDPEIVLRAHSILDKIK
jgi:hypothetical protein